jgi:site-specific DNA-cytosine methylase
MSKVRILELFCGIGGLAEAAGDRAEIVAAVDIDRHALAVYQHNFRHPALCRTIESLPAEFFAEYAADLWWLSPPCQPFTRRGRERDLDDSRCAGLVNVIERIGQIRPALLALENVPEFFGSRAHRLLREQLIGNNYVTDEALICPTERGVPNRRRRFYLLAQLRCESEPRRDGEEGKAGPRSGVSMLSSRPLADFLDETPDPALTIDDAFFRRFEPAMHIVNESDPEAVTGCFTSAYGRSPVHSGSYLRTAEGNVRRFSPDEIMQLLGFRRSFAWPAGISRERAWGLVGNSLSVPVVRWWLASILPLAQASFTSPASSSDRGGR